jgi:hypothetical protein
VAAAVAVAQTAAAALHQMLNKNQVHVTRDAQQQQLLRPSLATRLLQLLPCRICSTA